jgi:hypothetical protein
MGDELSKLMTAAQRQARNSAFDACLELCALIVERGGCANCCFEQITLLKRDMDAGDLARDALEKAAAK